uniref:Neuroendocrine protein 7B2 n=1 Tax=Steinernema glaseri TaxID=37863 RepID=A0A1I7Z2I3_9BILA
MASVFSTAIFVFFGAFFGSHGLDISQQVFPGSDFIDLISRDAENFPSPVSFGHKYMSGGAGEGDQQLRPEEGFEHRQQVKSDAVLPAYCEPPNPCPVGYTASDGCLEEFDNSAEFSRNYQAQQECICDQEHMFNCPTKNGDEYDEGDSLDDMLEKNGLHKNLVVAKKFHEKRPDEPRRKRSVDAPSKHQQKPNPYLSGEPLRSVSKKDGKNLW